MVLPEIERHEGADAVFIELQARIDGAREHRHLDGGGEIARGGQQARDDGAAGHTVEASADLPLRADMQLRQIAQPAVVVGRAEAEGCECLEPTDRACIAHCAPCGA